MAGIDQQVGAVPKIPIDTKRWYTTCFTWESNGRWRGYKDGVEVTNENTGEITSHSWDHITLQLHVSCGVNFEIESMMNQEIWSHLGTCDVSIWERIQNLSLEMVLVDV